MIPEEAARRAVAEAIRLIEERGMYGIRAEDRALLGGFGFGATVHPKAIHAKLLRDNETQIIARACGVD